MFKGISLKKMLVAFVVTGMIASFAVPALAKESAPAKKLITEDLKTRSVRVCGNLFVNGSFLITSDKRLKNIGPKFTYGLSSILKLQPINFTYKSDTTKVPRAGVLAQDLKKIMPTAVSKGPGNYFYVDIDHVIFALVNATKELNAKNASLTRQLVAEKQHNIALAKQITQINTRLSKLESKK